jgi:hypothetical protein
MRYGAAEETHKRLITLVWARIAKRRDRNAREVEDCT